MSHQPEYKTIRQWFEELPEPYRSQAIDNCIDPDRIESSQSAALDLGLDWGSTPQGYDYWEEFYIDRLYESK